MVRYFDHVEFELTDKGLIRSTAVFEGVPAEVSGVCDLQGALRTYEGLSRILNLAFEAEAKRERNSAEVLPLKRKA